jgi:CBS domain-containing protein
MFEFVSLRVHQYMSAPPVTVAPHMPLAEVEQLIEIHGINGCPVVDSDGRLLGMVTGFDLIKVCEIGPEALVPHYDDIMQRPVHGVMSPVPQTVDSDLPLTRVLQRMIDGRITGFAVVDSDRLVGMITRRDVLRALRESSPGDRSDSRTGSLS